MLILCRSLFRPRQYVFDWFETLPIVQRVRNAKRPLVSLHVRSGDKTHGNEIQVILTKKIYIIICI